MVRAIDLVNGGHTVSILAGTSGTEGYSDNADGSLAQFIEPGPITISVEGDVLYVGELYSVREIR